MKKLITTVICAAAVMTLAAAEKNLIANGGFEKISKQPKGTSKYLLGQIKQGWDVTPGPIAELPQNWLLNGGKGKLRIAKVGADGSGKENVHSGKYALHLEMKGGHIATSCQLKPGYYEVSFWYKGSGNIIFCTYEYGINPNTGKLGKHVGTYAVINKKVNSPTAWKQFKAVFKVGRKKETVQGSLAFCGNGGTCYLDDFVVKAVPAPAKKK